MFASSPIRSTVLVCTILFGTLTLVGCSGGGGGGRTTTTVTAGAGSQLYVSGNDGHELLVYDDANTVSGSVAPSRAVVGGRTTLLGPRGIAVDMVRNQVYVANALNDSILVFNNARTVTGDDAPNRTITGAPLSRPSAVFIDVVNNRLYVASTNGNSILVYNNASILNGVAAPNRTLSGATTALSAPTGIYVDTTRNLLYVANGNNQILIFNNAAILSGNVTIAPLGTISIPSDSAGIFVDVMADRLYVANTGANSILVFDNASTANGGPIPSRTLSGGGTLLNQPRDVFVDTGSDRLYVSNVGGNSILIFNNASSVNGNATPDRNLNLTASTGPWGIYVDVTPLVIGSTPSLDGFIAYDGSAYTATSRGGSPRTGDDESFLAGNRARQFFSFDLSNIPPSVTIVRATLRLYQAQQTGTPYNNLGDVVVDHVDYGAILDGSPGDYDGGLVALLGIFSTRGAVGYRTLDVTARVADDFSSVRGHSQYRLRFSPLEIDFNFASDYVQYTDGEDSCCAANSPPQLSVTLKP